MKIRLNRRQFMGFIAAILASFSLKACRSSNSTLTPEKILTK